MSQDMFSKVHAFVVRWEGGLVDHPQDPGGITKYGASLRWLHSLNLDVNRDGCIDAQDVKALTPGMVGVLFRTYFWDTCACGAMPALVGTVLYDSAVNLGPGRGVRLLQAACNSFSGDRLTEDGIVGRGTLRRVRELCAETPAREAAQAQLAVCRAAIRKREAFYHRLASRTSQQNGGQPSTRYGLFLDGWLARTGALWTFVNRLAEEGVR